jgi:hypothetical protein
MADLLGWTDGRNARIDTRWATNADDIRRHAAELAALAPDVILAATGTTTVAPLLQATRTVPMSVGVLFSALRECRSRARPDRMESCPSPIATGRR